jgi:sugar lactone lactonase YvrE
VVTVHKADVPASVLGEGPVWSAREQCLYYVDILSKQLLAYSPRTRSQRSWQFEQFVGSFALCRGGGLILALRDRIVSFDPAQGLGSLREIVQLECDRPDNRLNDGKTDPWGRFWVGSMHVDEAAPTGRLWCVEGSGKATVHRDGIGVSNSLAFDGARNQMYFADSHAQLIERASLDALHQPASGWQPFARLPQANPDGSCTDAEGHLWNAEWGGSRVVRYTPDGHIERTIELPVPRVSCCTFGGEDFSTLFITTARLGMTEAELAQYPDSGALFWTELKDVRGLPADLFDL